MALHFLPIFSIMKCFYCHHNKCSLLFSNFFPTVILAQFCQKMECHKVIYKGIYSSKNKLDANLPNFFINPLIKNKLLIYYPLSFCIRFRMYGCFLVKETYYYIYIRHLVGSTDQACSSGFYFGIAR